MLPSKLAPVDAVKSTFDAPTEAMTSLTPLLYQSGYITIKGYDSGVYSLGFPNREIETGLMQSLLPHFVGKPGDEGELTAIMMRNAINRGDMDGALRQLKDFSTLRTDGEECGQGGGQLRYSRTQPD